MTEELTKKCPKCGRELPLSEFCKDKTRKDGLHIYCKECKKEYRKVYHENHREEILKRMNEYYRTHSEDISIKTKVYRENHRDEISKMGKEYYENNRSDVLKRNKKYRKCVTNPSCPRVGRYGAVFEIFKCEICGAEFRRSKSKVDWDYEHTGYLPKYCSRECQYEAKRKTHKSKYVKEIERIKKEVG